MNKLIVFPLFVMFFIGVTTGGGYFLPYSTGNLGGNYTHNMSQTQTQTYYDPVTGVETNMSGEAISTTYSLSLGIITLDLSAVQFGILLMTGIVTIAALAGISAFGSGLKDTSIEIIIKTAVYIVLWGALSASAYPTFAMIPTFGAILYVGLTLTYILGWISSIRGGATE